MPRGPDKAGSDLAWTRAARRINSTAEPLYPPPSPGRAGKCATDQTTFHLSHALTKDVAWQGLAQHSPQKAAGGRSLWHLLDPCGRGWASPGLATTGWKYQCVLSLWDPPKACRHTKGPDRSQARHVGLPTLRAPCGCVTFCRAGFLSPPVPQFNLCHWAQHLSGKHL